MRERATFKSSVRIIRGAHLLWDYCGDNQSGVRRERNIGMRRG